MDFSLKAGEGRTGISLEAVRMGNDLVVHLFNSFAHIGAVAIGEYDSINQRASVSVFTRLGHKDDALAQKAAYLICKTTQKPVCVIAGFHLDKITQDEVQIVLENTVALVEEFIQELKTA